MELVEVGWAQPLVDRTRDVHAELHTCDHEILISPNRHIGKTEKELQKVHSGPTTIEREHD